MEREPGSNNRFERDPSAEFYFQVSEYLSYEILHDRENIDQVEQLREKIWLMQQILPYNAPSDQQDSEAYLVKRALEAPVFPNAPVTLPSPGRVIEVGKHMTVTKVDAKESWPDDHNDHLQLSDGAIIKPPTPIGRIDIVRNLPRLETETPLLTFTHQLVESSIKSLRELAALCESDDPRLSQVRAVAGTSHLARIANKFGFTTFEIENPYDRTRATEASRSVAAAVSGNNRAWQVLQENYKPAQVAYISRPELIALYGLHGPENIRRRLT